MVGDKSTVEHTVAIAVEVVPGAVHVIRFGPLVKILGRSVRTGNEVIVHQVLIVVGSRMSAHHAIRVVIYHIVVILDIALHLRVAALVVLPQTVVNSPVAGSIGNGPEALRFYTFGDYAVLPRDVVGIGNVYIVPRSPRHTAMVHDDIVAFVKRKRTLLGIDTRTATHTEVADNDIRALRSYHTSAIDSDTLARSCLPGNGDIAGYGNVLARDVDDAADIKNDEAVGLAHRFGQRTGTGRIQVGHMNHLSATSARGISPKSFGSWKCQLLRLHADDATQ